MAAKFFGQFLLEKGLITGGQLLEAVVIQATTNVMLGTRAIDAGLMTAANVEKVNILQRAVDKRFGELAVEHGMISESQLKTLLSSQKQERLFLGEALIKTGALTSEQLGEQLEAFKEEIQGIPGTVTEIYHELSNAPILEVFTDVVTKMFQRMLHTFVKAGSCHTDPERIATCDYTIHQEFVGDFDGRLCLNVSANLIKLIAGKLLETEVREVDEDTLDGAGEFINVISGNICAQLSSAGVKVEIRPPGVHDWKEGAFFLHPSSNLSIRGPVSSNPSSNLSVTVTSLLHPDEQIEICIVDGSTK